MRIPDEETIAIEIGEHPFVGIEAVAVGEFQPGVNVAEFGTERRRPGHGCIHMQPQLMLPANSANFRHRIEGIGRRGADRSADKKRHHPSATVLFDLLRQRLRADGELFVHFDRTQVFLPDPGDLAPFSSDECACDEV